jgi:hypothetical protein
MRGSDGRTGSLFSFVDLEEAGAEAPTAAQDPADGERRAGAPRCRLRAALLVRAPEKLLRAALLQAFFSVRSEHQLMEHLDYNLS